MLVASSEMQLGSTWDDIQTLAKKTPQAISQLVTIVNKGSKYLPQIVQIVDRAGNQIPKVLTIVNKYLDVAVSVVEDPALPAVMQRVRTIRELAAQEAKKKAASTKAGLGLQLAAAPKVGLGLERLVKPLDAYIYVRKHPWIPYAAGAGVILLLMGAGFGIGYGVARRKARKATK